MLTETPLITETTEVVANLETRYLSGGPTDGAPVVVFLHDGAWGGASDVTWGGILPVAAEKFRVIAPDLLGYGGSAKSIRLDVSPFAFRLTHLFSLLDHLGITEPVHLVGNSFGGSLTLRALTNPALRERIASVTTIAGTGGAWRGADLAKIGDFDGTPERLEEIVGYLCEPFDGKDAQLEARMRWAVAPGHFASMKAPHTAVPEAMAVQRPADPYPGNLTGVNTPALLIEGKDDTLFESGWSAKLQEFLPQAKAEVMDSKHSPNISQPQQTWDLINGFLTEITKGDNA